MRTRRLSVGDVIATYEHRLNVDSTMTTPQNPFKSFATLCSQTKPSGSSHDIVTDA
jgi:translation initiation factor 2B subunit (eIF-2B alpha/beta/delta family)